MRKIFIILVLVIGGITASAQTETDSIYAGSDLIFDKENLLRTSTEVEIGKMIDDYQKKYEDREIVVITTDSPAPFADFNSYAKDKCMNWQYIRPEDTNALLMIVSKKMGQIKLATGQGTTALIESRVCHDIINLHMMKFLKRGDFNGAIKEGITILTQRKGWQ